MEHEILQALVSISDAIYAAGDGGQLFQALSAGVRSIGFDSLQIASRKSTKHALMLETIFSSFPDTFLRDYERLQWIDVDPLAERAFEADGSFIWNSFANQYAEIQKRSFVDYLRSLQMANGLVVPKRHDDGAVSALAVLSLRPHDITPSMRYGIALITDIALAKVEKLGLSSGISADEANALRLLSHPQIEILKWMAEGKSNTDIATITGYSDRSVRHHVSEVLRKFGVATRLQAVTIFRNSSN